MSGQPRPEAGRPDRPAVAKQPARRLGQKVRTGTHDYPATLAMWTRSNPSSSTVKLVYLPASCSRANRLSMRASAAPMQQFGPGAQPQTLVARTRFFKDVDRIGWGYGALGESALRFWAASAHRPVSGVVWGCRSAHPERSGSSRMCPGPLAFRCKEV